jgi:hypothetical protein
VHLRVRATPLRSDGAETGGVLLLMEAQELPTESIH